MSNSNLEKQTKLAFSRKFREVFEASGMEIDEFCEDFGISRSTYFRYLAGETVPDIIFIMKIALECGEDVRWLVDFREK